MDSWRWQTNRQQTKYGQTNIQTANDKSRTNKQAIQTNHLSLKTPNGLLIRDWDGRTTNCDGGNGLSLRFNFFFRIFFNCSTLFSGPKWKMLLSKEEAFLYWKFLEKARFLFWYWIIGETVQRHPVCIIFLVLQGYSFSQALHHGSRGKLGFAI